MGTLWYRLSTTSATVCTIDEGFSETDTRLALWMTTDCADFSTYKLVAANDGNFLSSLTLVPLKGPTAYLVQLDLKPDTIEPGTTTGITVTCFNSQLRSCGVAPTTSPTLTSCTGSAHGDVCTRRCQESGVPHTHTIVCNDGNWTQITPGGCGGCRPALTAAHSLAERSCVGPSPSNDDVCAAIDILVNGNHTNFTLLGASVEDDEMGPGPGPGGANASCRSQHGWCSQQHTLVNTVWFRVRPVLAGLCNVSVSQLSAAPEYGGSLDVQLALYSIGNCSDFTSFVLLAANQHQGVYRALRQVRSSR